MDNGVEYKIKTEIFEGPLDILLSMIERRKLFINDISLAVIADDYIQYLKETGRLCLKSSSDFVWVAATLMLIKSRSLLPTIDLSLEEEKSIDDLEERLKEYKKIKELSALFEKQFGKNIIFFKNDSRNFLTPVFTPDKKISKQNMFILIKDILNHLPKKEVIPKGSVKRVISLEEMIENLTHRIKSSAKMSFREFSGLGKMEKVNVVVSFLAMLELVKQGIIGAKQSVNFGDIDMENNDVGVPCY